MIIIVIYVTCEKHKIDDNVGPALYFVSNGSVVCVLMESYIKLTIMSNVSCYYSYNYSIYITIIQIYCI